MNQDALSPAQKKTILVFIELLNKNKWLVLFLQKYPCEVEVAADGQDLFKKVRKFRPDIVLMDVQMPGLAGLDALRMIKHDFEQTKTILLSDIGSHSIGQSAIELEVDLYCDQSRRAVSVVRYLKNQMGLLSPKAKKFKPTKTLSGADLSQRMKDRYPVSGALVMEFEGQSYTGIFENISMEGAKIRVSQIPPLSSQIDLKWSFKGSPAFHLQALTVRQTMVFEPVDENVWVVGVKFVNLDHYQIKDLSKMISQISDFYEKKFEFVDFEQIRKMLIRQEKYFEAILQGQGAPSLVEKAMKEVREYERASFSVASEQHQCIAKMMSFRIISRVLRRSLDWVQIHPEDGLRQCTPLVFELLNKIDLIEADADAFIREEQDIERKKQLVESSNLILEQKDKLIQAFYDRCHMFVARDTEKQAFDAILKRYNDLQSYQHFLEVESQTREEQKITAPAQKIDQKPVFKTSKKTQEKKKKLKRLQKRKAEMEKIRKGLIPTLAAGIACAIVLYHGLNFQRSFVKPKEVKLSLAAQKIRIKNLKHLEVQADVRTWKALEPARQRKVLDELEVFLTARGLYQAKIVDGDTLIAAVYSTHDDQYLRYGYDIFVQ